MSLACTEPPRFTSKPKRVIREEEGLRVQLLCSASGSPQPKITWLKNGRVLHYKHHRSRIRYSKVPDRGGRGGGSK